MPRIEIFRFQVHFGDCDPAGIAFYPNFFRWYDAASRHFFDCCGLPPWRETEKTHGIIGVPLVEALDVVSQTVRPAVRPRILKMRELVAAGSSFADACKTVGGFDNVTIAVYRGADDPADITVSHDFENIRKARAFAASPRLKEVMKGAGVASVPSIWFVKSA